MLAVEVFLGLLVELLCMLDAEFSPLNRCTLSSVAHFGLPQFNIFMAMRACGEVIIRKVSKEINKKVKCMDDDDVTFIMKRNPIANDDLENKHKIVRNEKSKIKNSRSLLLMNTLKHPIILAKDGYDLCLLFSA